MAWNGPGTLLSRLGHTIEGMSGVQLYLKVPGCRTPGHQENNCFASVNINLGPGACVWYTVDGRHRDVVDRICRVKAHCTLEGGSWWPIYEDLLAAGVNVRRFEQKAGDLVLVGPSCIHWVQVSLRLGSREMEAMHGKGGRYLTFGAVEGRHETKWKGLGCGGKEMATSGL